MLIAQIQRSSEMTDDDGMKFGFRKRQEHFAAIGELHGFWAKCEGVLYSVLLYYCDLNEDVGRSIFAGPRVKAMSDIIKRLIENKPIEDTRANDMLFLLEQMSVIQGVRDKLTHHGDIGFHIMGKGDDEVCYTFIDNKDRPGKKASEYVYVITTKQLYEYIGDLTRIWPALNRHKNQDFSPWANSGEVSSWLGKSLSPTVHRQMFRVFPQ
jgi:hypothetical protein